MDHPTFPILPAQPNALLGRAQELNVARELLLSSEVRLLSFTGPPGVGKTRLAMAVGESLAPHFPDGVWFVDLSPVQDPALVASAVASLFGVAEVGEARLLDSLVARLQDRQALLFLDNFEQVLPAAIWLGKLLERTRTLKVLVTSRERLRLRWERTLLVAPLPLPDLDLAHDLSNLAANPSVALFCQRAAAVDVDFELTPDNAPLIAELCARLDGLPLAIELAAARVGVLAPAEILARMSQRFRMLGMGALDLPERHQTLRAAIDWSYEALSPVEQQLLRRLSVFAGSFSPAAAEVVADSSALELDVIDGLIALVEKSLVGKASGQSPRFMLLESIRAYAQEKVRQAGELDDTRRRHAGYYLALAERNYSEMKSSRQKSWFDLLEVEDDNLRAALQWSLEAGEPSVGRRMAAALWYFWWLRGHVREGVAWLEKFLESSQPPDETQQRLLEGAGTLLGWQGDYDGGLECLMEALIIARDRQDAPAAMRIIGWSGWILWVNGRTEQAAWLAGQISAPGPQADPWELAYAFVSLGSLLYEAGLDEAAEDSFTRALDYFQSAEERHGAIFAAAKLSLLKQKKGEVEAARGEMLAALEAARQLNDLHVIAYTVDDAVQLLAGEGSPYQADKEILSRLLAAVDHWRTMLSLLRTPREKLAYEHILAALAEQSPAAAGQSADVDLQKLPVETVIRQAAALLEIPNQTPLVPQEHPDRRPVDIDGLQVTLSERERQVLRLVAQGLSNQEIADRLYITERTVRFHVTSIFNKLGADNRTHAVAVATRMGLLNV